MSERRAAARAARRVALRQEFYERVKRADLDLAESVRWMRKIENKSQAAYAKLVGISPRVLIDFERGVGNPTLGSLQKMLAPFGLELTVRRRSLDPLPNPNTTSPRLRRGPTEGQ
jgi:putative transcriptional regulator